MVYGVVSDIHGNMEALESVLARLAGVERFICPGDIVGYGPDPGECCSRVRALNCVTVLGNHDAAVVDKIDIAWFNPDAARAALWTRSALDEHACSQLGMLPLTYEADDFLLVHGSLDAAMSFPYIYSPSSARPCFEEMRDYTLCLIGHSHLSEVYVQGFGERGVDQLSVTHGGKLDLRPGFRYIVNCGSVGQPRDGNPEASCGIYDSEANTIEIIRVAYDIGAVQAKMRDAGLPEFLAERLEFGK